MMRFWRGIKVLLLNVFFYSGLIFMTVVGILVVSVPVFCWQRYVRGRDAGKTTRYLIWLYGRAWARFLGFFVPLRLENCAQKLPKPCIFVSNHQSFFDTYCFGFLPEPDVVFAVRAWPFKMPFYGPYMRLAEYLNTEEQRAGALLEQGRGLLDKGTCIAIFPEGTRSVDGELQRFHAGAFRLSLATGVPIVPLCFEGTGVFLRKGTYLLQPASIAVKVLEPVWPEDFAVFGDEAPLALRRTVKERLQQTLNEFRRDTRFSPHLITNRSMYEAQCSHSVDAGCCSVPDKHRLP